MNKVILLGRLTADPEVSHFQGQNGNDSVRASYTLAVDRRGRREGDPDTDFFRCVAFGRNGEFAEKYLKKGMKMIICGRLQTGQYTNRDGQKVRTTDIVVEEHYFCESKNASNGQSAPAGNGGGYPNAQQNPAAAYNQPAFNQNPGFNPNPGFGQNQGANPNSGFNQNQGFNQASAYGQPAQNPAPAFGNGQPFGGFANPATQADPAPQTNPWDMPGTSMPDGFTTAMEEDLPFK